MGRLLRLGLCGLLLLEGMLANEVRSPWRSGAVHAAAVPSGLPGHFGFGLAAHPDSTGIYGWMPNSGIPWDYAYQYLSGGVNTGSGWETWNSSGQFALYYAQGATSHGYIPVFSYYEMLQSSGSCNSCGEAQRDLSNLNNAATMKSYFANFRLLMQRLGAGTYGGITGFGKAAIVQVEPDLSGHAEQAVLNNGACYGFCSGTGNNPALLRASVAGSGDPDVAAYPNTYQGFNWALLHLRDLYAPNVLLAFHVSDWATATDIGSNTSPSIDATALGQEAGGFAAQSGITGLPAGVKGYDLIFNDVLDRDAAYYKYVYNDPYVWWDRLNVTFPNFHRWEAYIHAVSGATERSVIVWQVPEGNQYFDTENNTNGHYQDNRAEYFFGHIGELVNSGIIGVLFGAGNGGSTVHTDGMADGVTNPASFCTGDGLSSGQICNNHTSTVSDDDGGYIRMEGRQYYASGGYSLTGGTATPTATRTPRPATATATRTALPPTATRTRTPSAPTATKTRTPVPPTATATRTATPAPAPQVSAAGTVSPASVKQGQAETLTAKVTSNVNLSNAIIDMEVYGPAPGYPKVFQQTETVSLSAGTPVAMARSFTLSATATPGTYYFKIGVFGPNWAPLYTWNDAAGTFTVTSG